jgi:hypothetical protein
VSIVTVKVRADLRIDRLTRSASIGRTPRMTGDHQLISS